MKYLIISTLIICNIMFSMDGENKPSKILQHIIHNGTLEEFIAQQSVFRKELDANELEFAKYSCSMRLKGLKQVLLMQENPTIKEFVLTMQKKIESFPQQNRAQTTDAYFEEQVAQYDNDDDDMIDKAFALNCAIGIVKKILQERVSLIGMAITDINTQIEQAIKPDLYLADERYKLNFIKNTAQHILDTEFGPQPPIQYYADRDLYGFHCRERKTT